MGRYIVGVVWRNLTLRFILKKMEKRNKRKDKQKERKKYPYKSRIKETICWKCNGTGRTWNFLPFGSYAKNCILCYGLGKIKC